MNGSVNGFGDRGFWLAALEIASLGTVNGMAGTRNSSRSPNQNNHAYKSQHKSD